MNLYELTVVLPGKATSAKKESTQKVVSKLVDTVGGKVKTTEDWGIKDLFFEMRSKGSGNKNFSTGTFLFFTLELAGDTVKKLSEKVALEDDFLRYLLVRA